VGSGAAIVAALGELGLALACLVLMALVLTIPAALYGEAALRSPALALGLGPVLVGGAAAMYRLFIAGARRGQGRGAPVPLLVPPRRPWGRVAQIVAGHAAAAIVGSFTIAALASALGAPVQEQRVVLALTRDAESGGLGSPAVIALLVGVGVAAVVAAPIAEELFFRRLLLTRLRAHVGPGPAIALSALAFALIHWNPAGFPVYLWIGLVFGSAYVRSGSWAAAAAVHAINNVVAFALLLAGIALGATPPPGS